MHLVPELNLYLAETLGLDVDSIGAARVLEYMERMRSASGGTWADLLARLATSEEERQRLYEALTVPETWFLRGRPALHYLTEYACVRWIPAHSQGMLRILSIPCSTGEEPYSVLMLLSHAGFPMDRVELDAVDISGKALMQAQAGTYGSYSFRGVEADWVTRCFVKSEGMFHIHEPYRERIHFIQDNAVSPEFLRNHEPYDVILCRNLLIYLVAGAREILLRHLKRLLHSQGMLFVGHSEVSFFNQQGWQSVEAPHAFAFCHPAPRTPLRQKTPSPTLKKPSKNSAVKRVFPQTISKKNDVAIITHVARNQKQTGSENTSLDTIQRLADAGNVEEALCLCEHYLGRNPLNADACCLAGLLENARNNDGEAIRYLEKALYLNPHHKEALYHLVLLYQSAGNEKKAVQYRRRLQRKQEEPR